MTEDSIEKQIQLPAGCIDYVPMCAEYQQVKVANRLLPRSALAGVVQGFHEEASICSYLIILGAYFLGRFKN